MNEAIDGIRIVATVKDCEQYRFKVELPRRWKKAARVELRRAALQGVNSSFLECSRRYQAEGWVGIANVAFADTKTAPSDSKSEFLHSLMCIKLIELGAGHARGQGEDALGELVLSVEASLSWASRKLLQNLCESLGIRMDYHPEEAGTIAPKPKIGGACRPGNQGPGAFVNQPVKRMEDFRAALMRRLTGRPWLKRTVGQLLHGVILLLWPLPILARLVFSIVYQVMAFPLLRRLDGEKNVFVYFDLRLGKNRDVAAYMKWKYGTAFSGAGENGGSVIPFSHLARPGQAYSYPAMAWAFHALKRMREDPMQGCVVVNFLIPPWLLWKTQFRRSVQRKKKRRVLRKLQQESPDFLSRYIYDEFISSLEKCNAFPLEVSKCYKRFFDALRPGVVVQADAVAKTARHFTACARQRGGRVIYVADRICTDLRTSNQFITDEGENFHVPDRCVVFDQVSRDEFLRQGMRENRVHTYHRNFAQGRGAIPKERGGTLTQVVILLQAYEDNMEGMVSLGADIATRLKKVAVVYQEHPNFPVCDRMKGKLLAAAPGRIRFLEPGESVEYADTLAMVTGYSTAAVPGILQGVPLIWLRRQVDNSIFGEAYLGKIGFAADKSEEVLLFLKRLYRKDGRMLKACARAAAETRKIFIPTCSAPGTSLGDALAKAREDSFEEIAAAETRAADSAVTGLAPLNA